MLAVTQTGRAPSVIPLRYDPFLIRADFPNPATRLTVNGQTAWFLIDTGAGVHVLASWFAAAARLQADSSLDETVRGADSTGRMVPFRGIRSVTGLLETSAELRLPFVAIADFPGDFERSEVGGILSPQLLAASGLSAALDLRVPELRFEPFDDAVDRLAAARIPRSRVQICGSLRDSVPNLVFAVPVSSANGDGTLLLDSGATSTKLVARSPLIAGMRLEAGGKTTGLAGERQEFSIARGLRLGFAGYEATVDSQVAGMGDASCGADGLLGLDALRECAIVLGSRDVALACGTR
jgi:hypothetical protein